MRRDDFDDDLPDPLRPSGVSPVWRLLAILGMVGVLGLLVALGGMAVALILASRPTPGLVGEDGPGGGPFDDDGFPGPGKNLPYPTEQDLRPGRNWLTLRGERDIPYEEPYRAFRKLCTIVPTDASFQFRQRVAVSATGERIAFFDGTSLWEGPPANLLRLTTNEPRNPRRVDGWFPQPGHLVGGWTEDESVFSWINDRGQVDSANAKGQKRSSVVPTQAREVLPTLDGKGLVLIRSRNAPMVALTQFGAMPDSTEVVLLQQGQADVLNIVTFGLATWRSPALSPDGKWLALISNKGHEFHTSVSWRVFVVPMTGGVPRPLTPPATEVRSVCWTPDGKSLVYDRATDNQKDTDVLPEEGDKLNLYEVDLTGGNERRLTWGGRVFSPTVTRDGTLWCVLAPERNSVDEDSSIHPSLGKVPLAKARELAVSTYHRRQSARAWSEFATAALEQAGLPIDILPTQLDAEKVKKLTAIVTRLHEERFGLSWPTSAAGLDRLRNRLKDVHLPSLAVRRIRLVLGIAIADYLQRKHGARWDFTIHPAGKPLDDQDTPNHFRQVCSPFHWFDRDDQEEYAPPDSPVSFALVSLVSLLNRVDGRQIVLAPSPDTVTTYVPAGDPDLTRGQALLENGKAAEGEEVLSKLLDRHGRNFHLAMHVGAVLHVHDRKEALAKLVKGLNVDQLKDARAYNLLGITLLPNDPAAAAEAFKKALRCSLSHGPAYVNLAEAYLAMGNLRAARQCLIVGARYDIGSMDDTLQRLAQLPQR